MLSSTFVPIGIVRFLPEYDVPVNVGLGELRAMTVGFSGGMTGSS